MKHDIYKYLQYTKIKFQQIGIENAEMEAIWLLNKLANTYQQKQEFRRIWQISIKKRQQKQPLAYIIKETDFHDVKIQISRKTLIPRNDSEAIIELANEIIVTEKLLHKNKTITIADIGTGSGCLITAIAKIIGTKARYVATDICLDALKIARCNFVQNIKTNNNCIFIKGDYLEPLKDNSIDIIITNPPYISYKEFLKLDEQVYKYEPILALYGGFDGMRAYRKIFAKAANKLKKNGIIIAEIGDGKFQKIKELAQQIASKNITIIKQKKDLKGHIRAIAWKNNDQ